MLVADGVKREIKRVDLSKLNPEQRAALAQFVKDAQAVAPQVEELKRNVQQIFANWLRQPTWGVAEGQPPEGEPPQQSWDRGAPTVTQLPDNYFERPSEK